MNEQELMKFAIERSNDPIIKNPVLRDAMNKDLGPRNMAQGGRIGYATKGFVTGSGPGTGSALEADRNTKIVKSALNKIKKQKNNKNIFEWNEKSDWYKKLRKDLGGNAEGLGMNRDYANKLINQVVDESFPGAYHGRSAAKNFRRDVVVNSFIDHLKKVKEFDGFEKTSDILKQFTEGKDIDHKYGEINEAWRDWKDGKFEVEGIDRKILRKELKDMGINYNQIDDWSAKAKQGRSLERRNQIKWLDDQNKNFPNRGVDDVEGRFKRQFGKDANFQHRIEQYTQIKRTGEYTSGTAGKASNYNSVGIGKGERSKWAKDALARNIKDNYANLIDRADRLSDLGKTKEADRLYKAADNFFGPKGLITKAPGQGEHALAKMFNPGSVDYQLKINSLVSGDLNQFKKWNFDIPVKQAFDEYNKPGTTKARKKELARIIEERKMVLNGLTGGSKKGMVADGVVSFKYGDTIIPTSDVPAIDDLLKKGKFNIQEFIDRGQGYTDEFMKVSKDLGLEQKISPTKVKFPPKIQKKLIKLGCGMYAGGRVGLKNGSGDCVEKALKKMDNPKGLSAVESKLAKEVVAESSKLKTLGSWVKGDVYFGGADMLNNWSKGQGFLRGLNNAVEQATLGAVDVEADEYALSKLIGEQGSKKDQEAFKDYLDASKKFNKLESAETSLKNAEQTLASDEIIGPDDQMLLESRIKEEPKRIKKLDKIAMDTLEKPTLNKGYSLMNEYMERLAAQDFNKTAGTPLDRGYREMIGAKGDEGLVWGPLFSSGEFKKFRPQDTMNYHPVYGYKEDLKKEMRRGNSPMEDILSSMDEYSPSNLLPLEAGRTENLNDENVDMGIYDYNEFADGGLAGIMSLKRKK